MPPKIAKLFLPLDKAEDPMWIEVKKKLDEIIDYINMEDEFMIRITKQLSDLRKAEKQRNADWHAMKQSRF